MRTMKENKAVFGKFMAKQVKFPKSNAFTFFRNCLHLEFLLFFDKFRGRFNFNLFLTEGREKIGIKSTSSRDLSKNHFYKYTEQYGRPTQTLYSCE